MHPARRKPVGSRQVRVWPLLLILVGFLFLWKRKPVGPESMEYQSGDGIIRARTVLGGRRHRITGEFRSGTLTALMGGGVIDLTQATVPSSGATLTVNAVMGGYEIQVPDSWEVDVQVGTFMGGVSDRRPHSDETKSDAPRLRLNGVAVLGGVGIK